MKKTQICILFICLIATALAQKETERDYRLDQRVKALHKAKFGYMVIPAGEIHEITIPVTGNITAVSVRPSGISGCANCNVTGVFKYPPPGNSTIPPVEGANVKNHEKKLNNFPNSEVFFSDAQGKKYPVDIKSDGRFFGKLPNGSYTLVIGSTSIASEIIIK